MPPWQVITAFAAIAGFMVSVMVVRTNEMDARIRAVEVKQVAIECAINPELCRVIKRPED